MRSNEGKVFLKLLIVLAVLAVIAFIAYRWAVGRNGIIRKVTKDEEEYNKTEVLEEINSVITQKYLSVYSKATSKGENKIEQFYNADKVIAFLKGYTSDEEGNINTEVEPTETKYIEDLKGEENCYYVIIANFKRDITSHGMGENDENSKDYFFIKKDGDIYNLYYKNVEKQIEEIGKIEIEPSV